MSVTEREQMISELRAQMTGEMMARFAQEKRRKAEHYRQLNAFAPKGGTLFTGSSLMEQFPIVEFCQDEGLGPVYNRGIGGTTTDDFLENIDAVLLGLAPKKLFINIGTNDIAPRQDGVDWFEHLSANYRRICGIIARELEGCEVYMMAYYPVNPNAPQAGENGGLRVRTNANIARANEMAAALAAEFGFHYIDVNDGLKDAEGNLRVEHTADGVHFDPEAYRTVFERLRRFL